MKNMTAVEVLEAGLPLLSEEGFLRGAFARKHEENSSYKSMCGTLDPEACCFCSLGAVYKSLGVDVEPDAFEKSQPPKWAAEHPAITFLAIAASELFPDVINDPLDYLMVSPTSAVIFVNDSLGRDATIKMWTRAIELAKAAQQ